MATTTNTLFKMVFTLKDNADPAKFAEIIEEMLECYKTTCVKEIHENIVEFGSSVSKHYGGMWGVVFDALESKLMRYIDGLDWVEINAEDEVEYEDVLSQFLEERENEQK